MASKLLTFALTFLLLLTNRRSCGDPLQIAVPNRTIPQNIQATTDLNQSDFVTNLSSNDDSNYNENNTTSYNGLYAHISVATKEDMAVNPLQFLVLAANKHENLTKVTLSSTEENAASVTTVFKLNRQKSDRNKAQSLKKFQLVKRFRKKQETVTKSNYKFKRTKMKGNISDVEKNRAELINIGNAWNDGLFTTDFPRENLFSNFSATEKIVVEEVLIKNSSSNGEIFHINEKLSDFNLVNFTISTGKSEEKYSNASSDDELQTLNYNISDNLGTVLNISAMRIFKVKPLLHMTFNETFNNSSNSFSYGAERDKFEDRPLNERETNIVAVNFSSNWIEIGTSSEVISENAGTIVEDPGILSTYQVESFQISNNQINQTICEDGTEHQKDNSLQSDRNGEEVETELQIKYTNPTSAAESNYNFDTLGFADEKNELSLATNNTVDFLFKHQPPTVTPPQLKEESTMSPTLNLIEPEIIRVNKKETLNRSTSKKFDVDQVSDKNSNQTQTLTGESVLVSKLINITMLPNFSENHSGKTSTSPFEAGNVPYPNDEKKMSLGPCRPWARQNKPNSIGPIRGRKSGMIKRDHSSSATSDQFIIGNEIAASDEATSGYVSPQTTPATTTGLQQLVGRDVSEAATIRSENTRNPDKAETSESTADTSSKEKFNAIPLTSTVYAILLSTPAVEDARAPILDDGKIPIRPTREPEVGLQIPSPENLNETSINYIENYRNSRKQNKTNKVDNADSSSDLFKIYGHVVACPNCTRDSNATQLNTSVESNASQEKTNRAKSYGTLNNSERFKVKSFPSTASFEHSFADELSPTSTSETSNLVTNLDENVILNIRTGISVNFSDYLVSDVTLAADIDLVLNATVDYGNDTFENGSVAAKVKQEFPWPVKKEAVVEGDLVLGGLMMIHEREDMITCGPVMPQGGIQALEAMLYTLDRLNESPSPFLPNITLGTHILDDCDKDTYGLEMAVDFIKGKTTIDHFLCWSQVRTPKAVEEVVDDQLPPEIIAGNEGLIFPRLFLPQCNPDKIARIRNAYK